MAPDPISTSAVDYLQRTDLVPVLANLGRSAAPLTARRLARVIGVGQPARMSPTGWSASTYEPLTLPLLVGMAGSGTPVAYLLHGEHQEVSVRIGTWTSRYPNAVDLNSRQRTLLTTLEGSYPVVDYVATSVATPFLPFGGFALGVPSPVSLAPQDGAAPIDRLLRSMTGRRWATLLLASPVDSETLAAERNRVLNELRSVASGVQASGVRSPLAEYYTSLLESRLLAIAEGRSRGGWQTAVYLLGATADDLLTLSSAWRAVFSGAQSLPEPIHTVADPDAAKLAADWAMPIGPEREGPASYRHPFAAQTLLSSSQLASYLHLPTLETGGFRVRIVPRFDTEPPLDPGPSGLTLGRILNQKRNIAGTYRVSLDSLTRHVFVSGATGSGKTNTIFALLGEADAAGVPFLVVEPAKAEYRTLTTHPRYGKQMRVFTAGNSNVSPFTLNPFEVPLGTAISEHLDLVKAAFTAAFGMWTPLPQILERCLHDVYAERGWDLRTNQNSRLKENETASAAFPTLTDLIVKVGELLPTLGYDARITGDLRAGLITRLEGLRSGGKGSMLDVSRSIPMEELLSAPTVIELETLGDDGDRAFLTALILIRLAEHRRAHGQTKQLIHLLVIEEAHRLFGKMPSQLSEESANPRGQAVETFSNLLSEIRAYGQGVIVADQVPVRLAPDVIKNTTLKIAHRTVSLDDRLALGGSMAMEETQMSALTSLRIGEAVVFGADDDSPMLLQIPPAKDTLSQLPPTDEQIAAHMSGWRAVTELLGSMWSRPFCAPTCSDSPQACDTARRLTRDKYIQRAFSRLVVATIDEAGALDREWSGLISAVSARAPADADLRSVFRSLSAHAAEWYAQRRGAQGGWPYADTSDLSTRLRTLLLDKLDGHDPSTTNQLRTSFRDVALRLHARAFSPYPACDLVCTQSPRVCLYRSAVADLVAEGRYRTAWRTAEKDDARSADRRATRTWEICQDAAYEITEFPEADLPIELRKPVSAAAKRVCLCFQQQMLAEDTTKSPRAFQRKIARVIDEAGV